ncbi:hypothetical protein [Allosphingosinicella sp.]|jgi:hypothetical protein|uniref:hypothetical protein n=1 Tax=Allosphingosinicella sp. TaxID=2823234 RepID=UPI002EF984A9
MADRFSHPIPVVCDRCRAEGLSGEDPFEAFGALLDFEPVPRRSARADGWDSETQRAYIAALSLTGNDRAACRAVGKSAFGVTQLVAHEGGAGFRAAREQALEIAAGERSRRLAEGLQAVAAEQSGWRPAAPPWAQARRGPGRPPAFPQPCREPELDLDDVEITPKMEELRADILRMIVGQYLAKLEQERSSRLQGRIAEADFYLRQITCLEVALDVLSGDGLKVLREVRHDGHDLFHIAETELSTLLDEARRRHWEECGDPPRPEYPPRHLLVEHGGFSTEPLEALRGGHPEGLSHNEQRRRYDETYARDAKAQVEWEAEARRDHERRRAAAPFMGEEPGKAGQPAPTGDRTDVTGPPP